MKKEMNCMKKNHYLWIVPLIVLFLVLCLACGQSETKAATDNNPVTGEQVVENEPLHSGSEEISIITPEPDPHRDELNAILLRTTMLQGVTVNGVSVGGMTMDEARAAVLPSIEQAKKDMQVRVDLGNISETFPANRSRSSTISTMRSTRRLRWFGKTTDSKLFPLRLKRSKHPVATFPFFLRSTKKPSVLQSTFSPTNMKRNRSMPA
jgi:hypothetical protein